MGSIFGCRPSNTKDQQARTNEPRSGQMMLRALLHLFVIGSFMVIENERVPLVLATDTEARVNQAIKVPMMLKCPADGRLFDIIKWEPSVCKGEAVTANVEVIIRMPDSSR